MPFAEQYNENYYDSYPEETYGGGGEGGSWSYMQGAQPYQGIYPSNFQMPTYQPQTSPITSGDIGWQAPGGSRSTSGYTQTSKGQYARLGDQPFSIPSKNPYGTETGQGQYNYPYATTGIPSAPGTGEYSFPELKLPTLDESRISELEQKAAAPQLRELRKSVREVQGKYYENPNVKRMTLRDALAGYGAGLEKVMTGARRQAQEEYEMEYQPQVQKAQLEWQAKIQGMMAQYQNVWRDYMARLNATTMG